MNYSAQPLKYNYQVLESPEGAINCIAEPGKIAKETLKASVVPTVSPVKPMNSIAMPLKLSAESFKMAAVPCKMSAVRIKSAAEPVKSQYKANKNTK